MIVPTIRSLHPSDREGVRRLLAASGYPSGAAWHWNEQASYVAEHKGEIVGFATTFYDGRHMGSIDWVIVSQDIRMMGVGFFLFKHAVTTLRKKGAAYIHVMSRQPEVVSYLERLGFNETDGYRGFAQVYDTSTDRPTNPAA